jgi:hypothetical protein
MVDYFAFTKDGQIYPIGCGIFTKPKALDFYPSYSPMIVNRLINIRDQKMPFPDLRIPHKRIFDEHNRLARAGF